MATPHFKDVPDEWKYPFNNYHQAPPEYGGEWWYVSPFNSKNGMPWEKEGMPLASDPPADFTKVFGPRPGIKDDFYIEWQDNLPKDHGGRGYFKGIKMPDWITEADVHNANQVYRAYDMGDGIVYEGRYGFSMRWPESGEFDFDWDARTAVLFPGAVIPVFQERLVVEGKKPKKWYPTVPPHLRGEAPK